MVEDIEGIHAELELHFFRNNGESLADSHVQVEEPWTAKGISAPDCKTDRPRKISVSLGWICESERRLTVTAVDMSLQIRNRPS